MCGSRKCTCNPSNTAVERAEARMSMADHAEAWWREQGYDIPARGTAEWADIYQKWVDYAFTNMRTR